MTVTLCPGEMAYSYDSSCFLKILGTLFSLFQLCLGKLQTDSKGTGAFVLFIPRRAVSQNLRSYIAR